MACAHPSTSFRCGWTRAIRQRLSVAVLLALALRALIPIGFMPAGDGTFSLMICPGGFPPALLPVQKTMQDDMGMSMPQPHHSGQTVVDDGFCIFTTGFGSAPPPLLVVVLVLLLACVGVVRTRIETPTGVRLVFVPQARAPPARA
jgi:hypothetical protein